MKNLIESVFRENIKSIKPIQYHMYLKYLNLYNQPRFIIEVDGDESISKLEMYIKIATDGGWAFYIRKDIFKSSESSGLSDENLQYLAETVINEFGCLLNRYSSNDIVMELPPDMVKGKKQMVVYLAKSYETVKVQWHLE